MSSLWGRGGGGGGEVSWFYPWSFRQPLSRDVPQSKEVQGPLCGLRGWTLALPEEGGGRC